MEYKYADVIIDPNDDRVKIGSYYYFGPNAFAVLKAANQNGTGMELVRIYSENEAEKTGYIFGLQNKGRKTYNTSMLIQKKEPPYKKRQAEWIKTNDIKVGDKVKIIKAQEKGCAYDMKPLVGTIGEIKKINDEDIQVYTEDKVDWWHWPYYCLEKVKEPEKKYVPFDLNNEEDRAKLRGAWVRIKGSRRLEQQIVALAIATQLVFLPDVVSVETKELLEGYEFLDGTPCGKLVEDEE